MQPKKDDSIYFAQSQGGGLIVDDKKNNIRYIIERDGRITKLFGSFRNSELNIYDMRDARQIADRVVRLLGRDHKYADFHYFLKGYRMHEDFVQKCSDFLDESVWGDVRRRAEGDVRKEIGRKIGTLPDGTVLVIPADAFSNGDLVELDDDQNWFDLDEQAYISVVSDGSNDVYYRYDEDAEPGTPNMKECFSVDSWLRSEDFKPLRAIMKDEYWVSEDLDELQITINRKFVEFTKDSYTYEVYENRDDAISVAEERERDLLESSMDKSNIEHFHNMFGDVIFEVDAMKKELESSQRSYYADLSEEEAIDALISYGVIEETEEYFELDEDGEIDRSRLKYNYADYEDEYVEKYMDNISGDIVDNFFEMFGYDDQEDYIDFDKLAERIVSYDGPQNTLASYDGKERESEIDGDTYYIYRTN